MPANNGSQEKETTVGSREFPSYGLADTEDLSQILLGFKIYKTKNLPPEEGTLQATKMLVIAKAS